MQELTKVAAINPANFQCTKSSPTDPAVWSNTNPQIALTHIFCGQIQRGKAEGFHSRPNNTDPVCARANNKLQDYLTYPLKCYKKIEVRQFINGFRDKWNRALIASFHHSGTRFKQLANILVDIYKQCQTQRDSHKICYRNFEHPERGSFGHCDFHCQCRWT